jgi:hypothetical protein
MPMQFDAHRRLEKGPYREWRRPLLIIVLSPLVTVPLTFVLPYVLLGVGGCEPSGWLGGVAWCSPVPAELMLAPGITNLAAAFWLLSRDAQTRLAAGVATMLGGLRFGVPLLAMLGTAAHIEGHPGLQLDAGTYLIAGFPNDETRAVTSLSVGLWVMSLLSLAIVSSAGGRNTSLLTLIAFMLPLGVAMTATGFCIASCRGGTARFLRGRDPASGCGCR